MLKLTIALFAIACVFAQTAPATPATPAAPATQSKLALLNSQKASLNNDDLGAIFTQDLSSVGNSSTPMMDDTCSSKLSDALKGAANDVNALSFIFTQATEGRLCNMLSQSQSDIAAAQKNYKDTENFTPVANKQAPAAVNAAPMSVAVPTPASTNKNINTASNNVDPATAAAQQAAQAQQMKAAQDAINGMFTQANNKMNVNSAMPNINFSAPPTTAAVNANADMGASLARVAAPSQ